MSQESAEPHYRPVKRVEIVTNGRETEKIQELLIKLGVDGYTLFPRVHGYGDRGEMGGDEMTDTFQNRVLLIACDAEMADRIARRVSPILKTFGGICLVSDAGYLEH
ncbi:MAG: P-II family nitrogen regulator [Opitutales bacterium]